MSNRHFTTNAVVRAAHERAAERAIRTDQLRRRALKHRLNIEQMAARVNARGGHATR